MSGLRGDLDPVGATAVAVHHVLRAPNSDIGAQRTLEHFELRLAQRPAGDGSIADRAVMFDEKEGVAVLAHLGQITLVGTDVGQPSYALGHIRRIGQRGGVARCLAIGSCRDHAVERLVTECRPHRADQVDGELTVAIGKGRCRSGRQLPVHGRAAAAGWFFPGPRHEPGCLESIEVLAERRVGEAELGGQIACRCGLDALQPLDDAVLGVGYLCHPLDSTWRTGISEEGSCIIAMHRQPLRFDKMYR